MRPTRGLCGVAVIVYGEENVCCLAEVGEGVADGGRVGGLHKEVGYAGAEEDDAGELIGGEVFMFEVSDWRQSGEKAVEGWRACSSQKAITCRDLSVSRVQD